MRIRHLATGAAFGALLTVLSPAFSLPALAEQCPTAQPPGRPPGSTANPNTGRPGGYPLGQCQLALSQSAGAAGARVGVSGNGFAPGSSVRVAAESVSLASVVADNAGNFATSIVVPASLSPGDHLITATGVDGAAAPRELSANFTVLSAAASRGAARSSADLPRTGSSATVPLVATGVGLVCLGAIAIVGSRRRRQHLLAE